MMLEMIMTMTMVMRIMVMSMMRRRMMMIIVGRLLGWWAGPVGTGFSICSLPPTPNTSPSVQQQSSARHHVPSRRLFRRTTWNCFSLRENRLKVLEAVSEEDRIARTTSAELELQDWEFQGL